jgi:hypothetical protein
LAAAIATFPWIPQKYLKALRGALDTLKEVVSTSTRKRDYLKASNKSVLYGFHTNKFSSAHDAKTNTSRVVKEFESIEWSRTPKVVFSRVFDSSHASTLYCEVL